MTDNRTTELLCKLLDERGIEWKDGDAAYEIEWRTQDGRHCSAMYWKPTFTVLISGCTPEQAIAATLGSDNVLIDQDTVRNLIEEHSYHISGNTREFFNGAYTEIADELNAMLGNGKCEFRPFAGEDWDEPNAMRGVCSECSALMYGKDNFCPNCGKAVKR